MRAVSRRTGKSCIRETIKTSKNDEKRLKRNWRYKVRIADVYVEFQNKFIKIQSDFRSLWDGHLGKINVTRHQIELFSSDAKP